jgi:AraC family transcriptional activator FtrA
MLEETDLGVDAVANRAGFGDAAMLRHHFAKRVGATPQAYRSTFRKR